MARSDRVSGTHEFTFDYLIEGKLAAEFECRCEFEADPGYPARPWSNDPGCGVEIEAITNIEVRVGVFRPSASGHLWDYSWVAPDPHLKTMLESHLANAGAANLAESVLDEQSAAA